MEGSHQACEGIKDMLYAGASNGLYKIACGEKAELSLINGAFQPFDRARGTTSSRSRDQQVPA